MIDDIVSNLGEAKDLLRMVPKLIPYIVEAHAPKMDKFLAGTEFTSAELFEIHQSLQDFHRFLQKTKTELDPEKAPTIDKLLHLAIKRNMTTMTFVLKWLVLAEGNGDRMVLTEKRLRNFREKVMRPDEVISLLTSRVTSA